MKVLEFIKHKKTINQKEFAKKVGISKGHMSSIISGRSKPSLEVAYRIYRNSYGLVGLEDYGLTE